jgi:hypothetical protein
MIKVIRHRIEPPPKGSEVVNIRMMVGGNKKRRLGSVKNRAALCGKVAVE